MTTPDHILPPPLQDTGPLETMAARIREMSLHEREAYAVSRVAISAIAEAGYAIVPVEPSREMLASVDDEDADKYVARGRAYSAWKAMIANRIKKGKPMSDSEIIRKLLELAGDQDVPEAYRAIALAGLNRIEALRSRLSQYEPVDG